MLIRRHALASAAAVVGLLSLAPAALADQARTTTPQVAVQSGHPHVFECRYLDVDDFAVHGRHCWPDHWGPLHNVVIQGPIFWQRYHCRTGWAEGPLWVRGEHCFPVLPS
ncbi:hypothetical protein GCM10022224_005820 [Nonomuraea antimicrobica]|uniref:Secreted protein n=1 Tax=Nonomuraea antimicrobica TaxID=561173 RepID=A0ABP7B164_9ACTN